MPPKNHLETAPLSKLFPKTAFPSVVALVSSGLSNLCATLLAAPLGSNGVAALGIVFSALTLLQAVGYTVALGGATVFAPAYAKKEESAVSVARVALWENLILGCIFGGVCYGFAAPIMRFLGAEESLLALCTAYGKPLFCATPLVCMNFSLNNLLRCANRPTAAMLGLLSGTLLTTALTPFCFSLFSRPLLWAGLAFLAGQGLSFLILLRVYTKTPPFSIKFPKASPLLWLKLPYYGMSSFLRQGLTFVSLLFLNRLARGYGTQVLAALSVCSRITGLCYSALLGWGQGFTPIGGFAFGRKNGKRLQQTLSFGLKTALLGSIPLGAAVCLYALTCSPLLRYGLLAGGGVLPLIPLSVFTVMGYQAIQKPLPATLLSCLRQGICLLPLLWLLPLFWGAAGLLIAPALSDLLTFFLCLAPYQTLKRRFTCFSGKEVI